jgi:hypothetical protein
LFDQAFRDGDCFDRSMALKRQLGQATQYRGVKSRELATSRHRPERIDASEVLAPVADICSL